MQIVSIMRALTNEVPPGKWLIASPQLISRIAHPQVSQGSAPLCPAWMDPPPPAHVAHLLPGLRLLRAA